MNEFVSLAVTQADALKSGNAQVVVENARKFLATVVQTRAKLAAASR